jgi:hypothetical protein
MPSKQKTGGRQKGTPNKVTNDVRAAFAKLLESNVGQMQAWLTAVAEGEKEQATKRDGELITDKDGKPVMRWLRAPDPGYAMKLVADLAEYHIPKLARTELSGEIGLRGRLVISD